MRCFERHAFPSSGPCAAAQAQAGQTAGFERRRVVVLILMLVSDYFDRADVGLIKVKAGTVQQKRKHGGTLLKITLRMSKTHSPPLQGQVRWLVVRKIHPSRTLGIVGGMDTKLSSY